MTETAKTMWNRYLANPGEQSFAPLYQATCRVVYTVAFRLAGTSEDAEDALQGAYSDLLVVAKDPEAAGRLPDPALFLTRAAARHASTLRKRRSRSSQRFAPMDDLNSIPSEALGPNSNAERRELRAKVEALVSTLPEAFRTPLLLHYFHGMTQQEIADALGCPRATVATRLQRGLKKLEPLVRNAGLGDAATALAAIAAGAALLAPGSAHAATVFAVASAAAAKAGAGAASATLSSTLNPTFFGASTMKIAAIALLTLGAGVTTVVQLTPPRPVATTPSAPEPPRPPVRTPATDVKSPATRGVPSTNVVRTAKSTAQLLAVNPPELAAYGRNLTHLSIDKPIYKVGEKVYLRAVVTDAISRVPERRSLVATIEILSPKGDVVARVDAGLVDGSFGWQWPIPEGSVGGDYTARVSYIEDAFPKTERKFNVRVYRQPRMRTQIEFAKKGYGPGDDVTATLEVSRVEGGIPEGATCTVTALVDQVVAWQGDVKVDAKGYATARFKLPDAIANGDGTLTFAIADGGLSETASKTIPILVETVDLTAFPESGDLVAGLPNRLYFQAMAPNGRPADVTVEVRDANGKAIARGDTEHEGRGSLEFVPVVGAVYTLQVVKPWTIKTSATLPAAKADGVILRPTQDRFGADDPVMIEALGASDFLLEVSNRDISYFKAHQSLANADTRRIEIPLAEEANGVLRVTASIGGKPVSERLIYREPQRALRVEITPDREAYIPGGKVSLKIRTLDETGAPVPAMAGLTITDDGTLEMVETREKAPRLPVMVYLEPEVQALADAHVYLSHDDKAPRSLDLLLGTQGWRRFAFIDPSAFIKAQTLGARVIAPVMSDKTAWSYQRLAGFTYDPTNGTISQGDVWRLKEDAPDDFFDRREIKLNFAAAPPPADQAPLVGDLDRDGDMGGVGNELNLGLPGACPPSSSTTRPRREPSPAPPLNPDPQRLGSSAIMDRWTPRSTWTTPPRPSRPTSPLFGGSSRKTRPRRPTPISSFTVRMPP